MPTALVTGPTSGIGRGFAERLASDGYDLVLVARDAARLNELAADLENVGVRAEVIVADLAQRSELAVVEGRVADRSRPVDILVNNAGFGVGRRFIDSSIDQQQMLIDVMVTAVMRLSHASIPGMLERNRGDLINVSSVASFLPFSPYGAAKAWVTSFSQGLATELHGTGVRAMALCPGFVRTEFHERAGISVDRSSDTWWLEVDDVVQQGLHDLRRGKSVSIPSLAYKTLVAGARVLPPEVLRRSERFRRSRMTRQV